MASAAANALASGSLSSSLTRPHATSDSRLLTNLVKCEKALSSHLDEEVKAAHTASAALAAWGTSEAPDIAATATRLSNLLNAVADVQRTHVQAIEGYRSALKDVLDREQSIRTVVRDRDILVGRLIKASKKTKGTELERIEKVNRAQRELQACEQVLQAEESALIGVKRRTFKEALTMRMKTMGDAGAGMVDAARDAIILLDGFDTVGGGADMGNRGIMGNSDGINHGMDESGDWEGEEDGRHQLNDPRMSAQFESASVTPSQSASQVQYGNRLNHQGPSQRYSTNLQDIGDASGPEAPEKDGVPEDTDTDSDDDYQEAFGGEHLNRHSNVPPPHLLSAGAGTDNDFLPSAPRELAPPNGKRNGHRSGNSPAPTPPRKDSASDLRRERAAAVAAHPPVPMPAIPTAPRLNMDGTNLGSIPRAPSLHVAGADADSSSDEDARATTQNRGGWGGSSRATTPSRPALRAGRGGDNSSDEGGTVTGKGGSGKRSNSFFGKVGKLFKTDLSKQPTHGKESSRNTPERARSNWETRTDANLNSVRGHDSVSRRASVLRGPINPPEPDSSDEDEPRDVVRNVNPRRPLWQGEKASSDVGVGGGLGSLSKRPSMLKRSSSNATARITPGPMSTKAAEEAARRSVIGAGFAGTPSKPSAATGGDGTASIKKKKKKKASSTVGSEVGTSATRTRASGPPPASSSGANDRTSIVVPGDASSGIRRSGSLSTGTGKGAAGSLSRTGTAQSIRSVDGGKKKRSSLASMAPNDGAGKFTTSSWIAKSETDPSVQNMTAAQAAANAGVVPKGSAAAIPTSAAVAPSASPLKVPKAPAPIHGSASRAAPLRPALKGGSLSRSGSYSSSAGPSPASILGPPIQAPPAASSIFASTAPTPMSSGTPYATQGPPRLPELSGLDEGTKRPKAPESALSIQEDKTFDGTGHLDVSLGESEGTPQKSTRTPTKKHPVPKLEMPAPEPFSIDLEARRGSSATGGTVSPGLMTPSQREAYERILGEESAEEVKASPSRHLTAQPEGVTRITDRSQKLSTSRVYSAEGAVDDSSSESEQGAAAAAFHLKEGSSEAARKAAEAQMSGAFSDEKSDPQLRGLSASIGAGQQSSGGGLHPAIKSAGPKSDSSSSAVGTGVERRKSVRMAPDTKLPPETPTGAEFDTTPRGGHSETKDPLAAAGAYQSQLSSRIAPPPQAPPRLPNKESQSQPIDLGRDRERSSWSTRIGQNNDDSSSDDDDTGGGLDSYASARRAFGSASRHLGKATGEIKPKKKKTHEEEVASVKSGTKTKSKKKKEPANHGYNTSVPLPAGLEVVGRSPSVKRK